MIQMFLFSKGALQQWTDEAFRGASTRVFSYFPELEDALLPASAEEPS